MSDPLAGAAVLVTGASSGIGRALVAALVARGACVVAAARSADRLAALAAELGARVEPVVADVGRSDDVQCLIAGAGRLDAVINNAGIGHVEPFLDSDPAGWQATLDTNLVGALLVARAALPAMLAAGRGVVLNVGSASAAGWPYLALYAASKAALRAASVALDREYVGRGVRVLHVEIGPTQGTDFGIHSDPAHLPTAAQAWTALGIPWKASASTPADAAATILTTLSGVLQG